MSTISHVSALESDARQHNVYKTVWANLASGDVGQAVYLTNYYDKTIQCAGTMDGGSVTIQGTNNNTSGPWVTLKNAQGNDLIFTSGSAQMQIIIENPLYIRPIATGGSGSLDITLYLVARGGR